MKIYKNELIIKHDPRGICLLEFPFCRKYNANPIIEANSRIILKENGPKRLPKPAKRMKSPPPIPSLFEKFL
tara:strand:+ start:54 stop:269 length:216 start_codon:yes stop_codon:yes gene_type:complete